MSNVMNKIKTFGRVGYVFCMVSMIVCAVGGIGCLIAAICCSFIPRDFINVKYEDKMDITVSTADFVTISEEEQNEAKGYLMNSGNTGSGMKMNETAYRINSITEDGDSVVISGYSPESGFDFHGIVAIIYVAAAYFAITFMVMLLVGSLCKELKQGETPFNDIVIKKLRCVAHSLIPMAIITTTGEALIRSILAGGTAFNLSMNFGSVIMIILVFGLVQIFKYGAVLQRESDETL